jgi:hypothetical protein
MGNQHQASMCLWFGVLLVGTLVIVPKAAGKSEPPWELKDLNASVGAESAQGKVTIETHGRYTGMPVLRVSIEVRGRTVSSVDLPIVYDAEDYKNEQEACFWGRSKKGGNVGQLEFKSKVLKDKLSRNRGAAKVVAQVLMVSDEDKKGKPLTNAVKSDLSSSAAGVRIQSVLAGSAATQVVSEDDGKVYGLEPGDRIIQVDGKEIKTREDLGKALAGKAKVKLKVVDKRTGKPRTFTAEPQNGILGVR